jgi:IS30 family transposase
MTTLRQPGGCDLGDTAADRMTAQGQWRRHHPVGWSIDFVVARTSTGKWLNDRLAWRRFKAKCLLARVRRRMARRYSTLFEFHAAAMEVC